MIMQRRRMRARDLCEFTGALGTTCEQIGKTQLGRHTDRLRHPACLDERTQPFGRANVTAVIGHVGY